MLELRGVSAGYGRVQVLRGIDLQVHPGEVVCLLGANGAGKTTLIRTVLGLVRTDCGQVLFNGRSLIGLRSDQIHALGIGVIPEGKRLFPRMTVLENLRMGAFLVRDESETRRRINEVMELFPRLRERAQQLTGTMSGGEQSMCAIARGLMSRPSLLIMDEPSFGLAPVMVQDTFRMVRRISEAGTTVLMAEQNAHSTLQIAHRGYVLQKGEIIASGTTAALRASPAVQKAYLLQETAVEAGTQS